MPKFAKITLRVAIDLPKGAEICDGYIHLPSGEALLPIVAFENHQDWFLPKPGEVKVFVGEGLLADESDIEAVVGSAMEYTDCTIEEVEADEGPSVVYPVQYVDAEGEEMDPKDTYPHCF
jgi:hypothetical protein